MSVFKASKLKQDEHFVWETMIQHEFEIFFNSVLRPFQDYFSSYETDQSVGGSKRENPEKNHLAHPQAEHVAIAGLEPTPDTAVR